MRIDQDATQAVVDAALNAGVTLFDTADIYGESEVHAGQGARQPSRPGRARHQVRHATCGAPTVPDWARGVPRRYIRTAVERSLRRLETDWIDLYQLHSPDPLTPIEETLRR